MPKKKTPAEHRAELMREMEKNDQEIARLEHKQEQLDHQMTREKNTLAYLSAKERKARTHRLVQKGAIIEHHSPETKELTEQEIYALMENILALPSLFIRPKLSLPIKRSSETQRWSVLVRYGKLC